MRRLLNNRLTIPNQSHHICSNMGTERHTCSEHWQQFAYEIMVINRIELNQCHIVIASEDIKTFTLPTIVWNT